MEEGMTTWHKFHVAMGALFGAVTFAHVIWHMCHGVWAVDINLVAQGVISGFFVQRADYMFLENKINDRHR
jgi:hypothetical protein